MTAAILPPPGGRGVPAFANLILTGLSGTINPNTAALSLYYLVGEKDQATKDAVKILSGQLEQQGFNVKYEEMTNVGLDWPVDTSGKIINWFESLLPAGK